MRYEYQDRVALSALIHCNFRRSSSMKTRLIAVMVAMLAFYGVVSAQGYHIRTTFHTNLRDTYSLSGGIVATVPPGAVLHVVGNVNRWLKINRNGNEAWMADWVGYTRVESSDQTGTQQQTSLIDNCCFVDRQCSTNKQWTDGYWAFQNGQCTAPAQSQEQTSTPATGSVSANIDNCCYVDRQCNTDQQWTDGYWAYQNNQCAAPAQSLPAGSASSQVNNCCFLDWQCHTDDEWLRGFYAYQNDQCIHPGIFIEGSERFTSMMKRVLDSLKTGAPQWYGYIINSGLQRIKMQPPGDTGFSPSGMTYSQGYHESFVQDEFYHIAIAGILTHECCHAYQWITGKATVGWRNEIHCVEAQLAVHEALDPICRECAWYRNIIANIENPEWWWWD